MKRITESKSIWLGSNVFMKDGTTLFKGVTDHHIVQVGEFKVGMFGLCTHETELLSHPDWTVFTPVMECARLAIEKLRNLGADVIVAITHQSIQEDRLLARKVKGMAAIIGGHDHSPYSEFEGDTLIHKSGQNADYLGRIDLTLTRTKDGVKVIPSYSIIPNRGYAPDPAIQTTIRNYTSQLDSAKDLIVAVTETALDSKTSGVRSHETSMGNLVTDSVRQYFNTQIAIIQGGAIRGDGFYSAGSQITQFDLNREFPFPNTLTAYEIAGQYLKSALEDGVRYLPNRSGSFPQVSGMTFHIDMEKEFGSRVSNVKINGKDLEPDTIYSITSTEFIRKGGDGYASLRNGKKLNDPKNGITLYDVFMSFLKEKKTVRPATEGRIVIA